MNKKAASWDCSHMRCSAETPCIYCQHYQNYRTQEGIMTNQHNPNMPVSMEQAGTAATRKNLDWLVGYYTDNFGHAYLVECDLCAEATGPGTHQALCWQITNMDPDNLPESVAEHAQALDAKLREVLDHWVCATLHFANMNAYAREVAHEANETSV